MNSYTARKLLSATLLAAGLCTLPSLAHTAPTSGGPSILQTGFTTNGRIATLVPADGLPLTVLQSGPVIKAYKCADAECSSGTLSNLVPMTVSRIRLVIGSDGLPMIGLSITNNGLRVLRCANLACSGGVSMSILDGANLGASTDHAVIVPPDGLPIFAYSDFNNGDLRVARCHDSGCNSAEINTVDSLGTVGRAPAITLVAGLPQIAYGVNDNSLRLARCADMACNRDTLFQTFPGAHPTDSAMLTGHNGAALIAYKNDVSGQDSLRLVQCTDVQCSTPSMRILDTVEFGLGLGGGVQMVRGGDGLPVLSYFDQSFGTVKLLRCTRTDCASSTITTVHADSAAVLSTAATTALAIGAEQTPFIAYALPAGQGLTLNLCNTRSCQ